MKKIKSGAIVSLALGTLMLFTACGGAASTPIDFYSGGTVGNDGKIVFNEKLFYMNEDKGPGPDPFVLDDTKRSGYYYIGSTQGEFVLYRSKDMMTVEAVGPTLDLAKGSDQANAAYQDRWAPEYIFDEDDGCYYMFFSATPANNGSYMAGEGVVSGTGKYVSYLARASSPEGPYEMIDFTSQKAVEEGWSHNLNAAGDTRLTVEDVENGIWGVNGEGAFVMATEENYSDLWKPSYPQSYAKYSYLDPAIYASVGLSVGKDAAKTHGGFSASIDFHPFIDPVSGDKYLYWTISDEENFIVGVKMYEEEDGSSSWLKPDWSTFTLLTAANYWTIEDYRNNNLLNEKGEVCYDSNTQVNEGVTVLYHDGKYHMTFSINSHDENSYEVCQAVADAPLGAFRKLREEENGRMLSGELEGSEEMSGTGHNAIITIGDQMFIYYHSHNSFVAMGSARHGNIDELKWVTIKDYQGNDLNVLVANGPTATVQPRIEEYSKYKNVAADATITLQDETALAEGSDYKWANDGLLSVCKNGDPDFYDVYVQETRITKTATFEITLLQAASIRAVMVYNSKYENEVFRNISRMEFVAENGEVYYLENVAFPPEYYSVLAITGEVTYVSPGAAAFAEFYELAEIKTVRVTVDVPEGQDAVGISEIRVLGR